MISYNPVQYFSVPYKYHYTHGPYSLFHLAVSLYEMNKWQHRWKNSVCMYFGKRHCPHFEVRSRRWRHNFFPKCRRAFTTS